MASADFCPITSGVTPMKRSLVTMRTVWLPLVRISIPDLSRSPGLGQPVAPSGIFTGWLRITRWPRWADLPG